MSLREELKATLTEHQINFSSLTINKDADYKGRPATQVGFIINGDSGPVFYNTTITDDLKLPDNEEALLIAKNAAHAYANHMREVNK